MAVTRIEWVGLDGMRGRVAALGPKTTTGLRKVLVREARVAEGDVKVTAPWTDRTGAARNGLYATAEVTQQRGVLEIGHGVDYGIWLEVSNAGRFAAVTPTLQRTIPRVAAGLRGLW